MMDDEKLKEAYEAVAVMFMVADNESLSALHWEEREDGKIGIVTFGGDEYVLTLEKK